MSWEDEVASIWADDAMTDEARITAIRALSARAPHPAVAAFELGGAYDSAGREADADVEYRRATELGLSTTDPDRAAQLLVQHASTLRNLGRLDEAIEMLRSAPPHPATGNAPAVFLALALHSSGRVDEGLRVAIDALEPTLPRYRVSVRRYAAALTEGGDEA